MPLLLEIIAVDGTVTRVPPERGLARVSAEPGSTYRIVDDTGASIGEGARVLRYENDLVVTDLPGEDTFEVAGFFENCAAESPCQFSLAEIGGAPGEVITPTTAPAAALTEGGFLMAAPGAGAQSLPPPPESDFNWKPIAGIGGGIAIAGAGLGGGGGGGGDETPPTAPTIKSTTTNDTTPVLTGTAEPGSQVTLTLNPGGTGSLVTFTTTTDSNGNWAVDTGSQTPTAGTMPEGGLPTLTPTTIDLVARDAAGNLSTVSSGSVTLDLIPPNAVASLTAINDDVAPNTGPLAQDAVTNDNTPRIDGTIDQALEAGDRVQVLRDGVVVGEATVNGLSWTFTDGPVADTPGSTVSYSARVSDAAGNFTAATAAQRLQIDTQAPPAPSLAVVAGDDIVLKPEADAGVVVSGTATANANVQIDWGNGARDVTADAAGTFTTVFQTADLPADGQISLTAVSTDAAGNTSAAATRSVLLDRSEPSLTITSGSGTPFNGANLLTFTFSEAVTGFELGDITLGGGVTAGALSTINASTYTLQITPPATSTGTATVNVAAGTVADLAGNANTTAAFSQAFDTIAPTPTISDNIPAPEADGPITFTFDFGEAVTGFTAGDIAVAGGTGATFTGTSGSAVYTLLVNPTPNASGTTTVTLAGGAAIDAAGNASTAAAGSQNFNTDRPTLTIAPTSQPGGGPISPAPNGTIEYTFTFSEAVTGFTLADIVSLNSADSNLSGSGAVYTADIAPNPNFEGNIEVSVAANRVQDSATNGNLAASSGPQPVDTLAPTLTIADDTVGTATGPVTYTLTFSESVTGLTAADITVTNGTRGALSGSGTNYSITATPDPNSTADLGLSVAANAAQDASGNNSPLTAAAAQPVDTEVPALVITDDVPGIASGAVTFTFDFGEPVAGFALGDIDITASSGPASFDTGTLTSIGGGEFELVLTPDPGQSGTFTLTVADGVASDAAGNDNTGVTGYTQAYNVPTAGGPGFLFPLDDVTGGVA